MVKYLKMFNNYRYRDPVGLFIAFMMITFIPLVTSLFGFNGLMLQHIFIVVLLVMVILLYKSGR